MSDLTSLYRHMPISFNGIVIENTSRCNAACSMCYQAAGPKGSDIIGKHSLNNVVIKKALEEALGISVLTKRFHLAGGEAFLNKENCLELIEFATKIGYSYRTATSNCYWAKKLIYAKQFAHKLKESGLSSLEISWDEWHRPFIDPMTINNAIIACHSAGINVNLRILTTKSCSIDSALSTLDSTAIDLVDEISTGPVFKTGRAKSTIGSEDFYESSALGASCHSVLNL